VAKSVVSAPIAKVFTTGYGVSLTDHETPSCWNKVVICIVN